MNPLLNAALAYASRGWPVFPCHSWTGQRCTCNRTDCDRQAKHPRTGHGCDDASCDADQVRSWWSAWPDANIGVRTGVAFDALDVDGPEGETALPQHLADSDTVDGPTVTTGKGWHVYVAPTGLGNKVRFLPHIDWRGDGAYVIAPPSLHMSGRRYRWEQPTDPIFGWQAPLRPAPGWLLELLNPPKPSVVPRGTVTGGSYGRQALEGELGRLACAPEGQRNHTLVRAAFRMGQLVAGRQLDASTVIDHLAAVAARIGLTETETAATIRSGLADGMGHPRSAAA